MKDEELLKAAGLISSNNMEEIAKGLGTAEGIERESIEFYSNQAKKASDSHLQGFFEFLVEQEKEHLNAINKLRKAVEEKGEWTIPELPKAEFKVFSERNWDKGKESEVTPVLFAFWKEKEAQEFYSKTAKQIKNEKGREFFEKLAEFEKGHADMLSEYIEDSFYSHELVMG